MNPELLQYIKKRLDQGATSDVLVPEMAVHGWPESHILQAIAHLKAEPVPTFKPEYNIPSFQNSPISQSNNQATQQFSPTYAGFWIRFVATAIDGVILTLLLIAMSFAIGNYTILQFLSVIIGLLYFTALESSNTQATIGKKMCGLVVTSLSGEKIGFGKALLRYISKILSTITFLIGYIMVGFTEKKQGLHDKIAKTIVVKRRIVPVGTIVFALLGAIVVLGLIGGYATKKMFDSAFSSFEQSFEFENEEIDQPFGTSQENSDTNPSAKPSENALSEPSFSASEFSKIINYYDNPYNSAGPVLIIYDEMWLDVVAPASLSFSNEESMLNITTIVSKENLEIYDANSKFESDFFRSLDFTPKTSPTNHFHSYRKPALKEGYTLKDIARIEGVLVLKLTSGQTTYPFVLNVR